MANLVPSGLQLQIVVLGQLGWALEELGNPKADPAWAANLKEMRESFKQMLGAGAASAGGPIHPALLVQEVRARLSREAAIALDGGEIAGFAMTTMDAHGPGSCTGGSVERGAPPQFMERGATPPPLAFPVPQANRRSMFR